MQGFCATPGDTGGAGAGLQEPAGGGKKTGGELVASISGADMNLGGARDQNKDFWAQNYENMQAALLLAAAGTITREVSSRREFRSEYHLQIFS